MSSVAGSSAGFDTFRTASPAPSAPVSRNVWSRSLPRLRAPDAANPYVAAAIAQASSGVYAGGWACSTASMSAVSAAPMAVKVVARARGTYDGRRDGAGDLPPRRRR